MMTDNEILDILKDCDLRGEVCLENFHEVILNNLPRSFRYQYQHGVSKLVILPDGEDFVIKIPFNGKYEFDSEKDEEDEIFCPFCCANGTLAHEWDYCFTELCYYHDAKKQRVADVLLKPHFVGTIDGYPIYTQERVETFYARFTDDDLECDYKEDCKNSVRVICSDKHFYIFNIEWMADVFDWYGEKRFTKIMKYIEQLNDLHENNVGYTRDNRPIILDYSDWND